MFSHGKQKKKQKTFKAPVIYLQCLVNLHKSLSWNWKSPHSFSNILHYLGCEDVALHQPKQKQNTTHFTLELKKNTFQSKSLLFQTYQRVVFTHASKELHNNLKLKSKSNKTWETKQCSEPKQEHVWQKPSNFSVNLECRLILVGHHFISCSQKCCEN